MRVGVGYDSNVGNNAARSGSADGLDLVASAITGYLGATPVTASMTFVGVEQVRVLRFAAPSGISSYVSLGMSRSPMTAIGPDGEGRAGPRAELVLQLRGRPDDVWRHLAVLAAAPTVESTVYQPGMTVDLGVAWTHRSRCTGAVVTSWPSVESVDTMDGCVELLQLLPATATELAWSRVHGTAQLRDRWVDQAVDLLDIERAPVSF